MGAEKGEELEVEKEERDGTSGWKREPELDGRRGQYRKRGAGGGSRARKVKGNKVGSRAEEGWYTRFLLLLQRIATNFTD